MGEAVEPLHSPVFGDIPHGFLTRRGGVSTGVLAGLNVGLGAEDEPPAVAENRRRAVAAVLPDAHLVTLFQAHTAKAVVVDTPWGESERPRADALATRRPGLLLGIVTADCAPVLLADPEGGVVGAAHAGWKGAHGGVIRAAVVAMVELGARRERIVAAIGPCIARESYEVGEDFRERFASSCDEFFSPGREGHYQFDLEAYVASRLAEENIGTVDRLGMDTYGDPARFFSFRRSTHAGEATYGRQLSLIGLPR